MLFGAVHFRGAVSFLSLAVSLGNAGPFQRVLRVKCCPRSEHTACSGPVRLLREPSVLSDPHVSHLGLLGNEDTLSRRPLAEVLPQGPVTGAVPLLSVLPQPVSVVLSSGGGDEQREAG